MSVYFLSDLYHHILVISVRQKFDSSLSSKLRAQGSSFSNLSMVSSQILSHIALLLGSLSKQFYFDMEQNEYQSLLVGQMSVGVNMSCFSVMLLVSLFVLCKVFALETLH